MRGLHVLATAILAVMAVGASGKIYKKCPPLDEVDNKVIHIAHETDCTKFYKCQGLWKYPIPMDCPFARKGSSQRLHFHPEEQVCDWPFREECEVNWDDTTDPTVDDRVTPYPWTYCPLGTDEDVKLVHEKHCSRYYQCNKDGLKIEKFCPDGKHFDPMWRVCDVPEKANCKLPPLPTTPKPDETDPTKCPPKGSSEVRFFPHECQCSRYYKCEDGDKVLKACTGSKSHFNRETDECDLPSRANCPFDDKRSRECPRTGESRLPHESDCGKYYQCSGGQKIEEDCVEGSHFDEKKGVCRSPAEAQCKLQTCPAKGSGLSPNLPHECSCSNYYRCEDGRQTVEDCQEDYHFDEDRGSCVHKSETICTRRFPDGSDGGDKTTTIEDTIPTEPDVITTTPEPEETDPTKCPPKGSKEVRFFPHECQCSRYYKCEDGEKVLKTCSGTNSHFNRMRNTCDLPTRANCPYNDKRSRECPARGEGRLPHETSCSKYYQCSGGIKTEESCEKGLHFVEEMAVCGTPEEAQCKLQVCPGRDSGLSPNLPHECSCSNYYKCADGKQTVENCQEDYHFDDKKGSCVHKSTIMCTRPIPDDTDENDKTVPTEPDVITTTPEPEETDPTKCPPKGSKEVRFFPHECQCSRYYKCEDGEKVLKTCSGTNSHFNRMTNTCDLPTRANCPYNDKRSRECPTRGEGRLPHETSCSKYYQCSGGRKTEESCEKGLHFVEEMAVCGTPEEAQCKLQVCPGKDSGLSPNLPHECSCSNYYKCADGKQTVENCQEDYHFDDKKGSCVHKSTIMCTRPFPDDTDENDKTVPTEPDVITTTPEPEETDPTKCPPKGSKEVRFFPHECQCSRYYKCEDGEKVLKTCSGTNSHFNRMTNTCDLPTRANCPYNDKRSRECPTRGEGRLPHETSCSKYYQCSGGRKTEESCEKGLHFVEEMAVCGTPEEAQCKLQVCPGKDSGLSPNLPHECSCSNYYKCADGKQTVENCQEDYHFDDEKGSCVHKSTIMCTRPFPDDTDGNGKVTEEPTSTTEVTDPTVPIIEILPNGCPNFERKAYLTHETNCSKYYICENGHKNVGMCPRGYHFYKSSVSTDFCLSPRKAECDLDMEYECPFGDSTVLRSHGKCCSYYYRCTDGKMALRKCSKGMYFDEVMQECNWEFNVECTNRDSDCDISPSRKKSGTAGDWQESVEMEKDGNDQSAEEDSSLCSGICPLKNPVDHTVHLPHADCTKFCKCDHGEPVVFKCPDDLHFNKVKSTCDWPVSAGCDESLIPKDSEEKLIAELDTFEQSKTVERKHVWQKIPFIGKLF